MEKLHREVIHGEISRAVVLNLSGYDAVKKRCKA
jgi:hypothetical protein